jgi:hypothetical protein
MNVYELLNKKLEEKTLRWSDLEEVVICCEETGGKPKFFHNGNAEEILSRYDVCPFYAYSRAWVFFPAEEYGSVGILAVPRHPNTGVKPVIISGEA